MAKHIIFINGLGGYSPFYWLVMVLWRLFGYKPHYFRFEWADPLESYEAKMQRLAKEVEKYEAEGVAAIGVSAGGTAAVNILAHQPNVVKVITVSSPYYLVGPVKSKLLQQSCDELAVNLGKIDTRKIHSFYGHHDLIVGVKQSQPVGIKSSQLPSRGHVGTIVYALVVGTSRLRQVLRS